jgi:NaMN:DMB phosphoribosyltransferase
MTFDSETLLDMIDLEKRRSVTARVFSTGGLMLGGALVGAALALLLTPKSGAELRSDLKGLTNQLKEKAVDPLLERMNAHPERNGDGAHAAAPVT